MLMPGSALDGWADIAADQTSTPIKGQLTKCNDGQWFRGKEATPINGQRFAAMAVGDALVKWRDNKPSEYLFREHGKPLAARNELGDLDESQWEAGPDGKKRDPWVRTQLLYLVDEKTAEWAHVQHDHYRRAHRDWRPSRPNQQHALCTPACGADC
jgi:hypothetical protein